MHLSVSGSEFNSDTAINHMTAPYPNQISAVTPNQA
jgi:hypothetical protein